MPNFTEIEKANLPDRVMSKPVMKSHSDRAEPISSKPANEYRAICKTAILSVVLAFLASGIALLMFLVVELAMFSATVALVAMIFGLLAWLSLRRYPDELIGRFPAKLGLITSSVIFITSVGLYSFVYSTEVPDGHRRISFTMLKPDRKKNEEIPPEALELDGQKVFIKGFVRPSTRKVGLEKFLLVGDFGSCCFGGNPKITDVIAIDLKDGLKADYSYRVRRIAGTFRLNRKGKLISEDGVPQVYYTIEADYIK